MVRFIKKKEETLSRSRELEEARKIIRNQRLDRRSV